MPPPGGRAGKAGDRYEAIWATVQFVRVLRREAEWIHLESYGVDEAEFQVRVSGRTEYHQVKRQKTGGDWTIASLEGVLRGFRRLLSDASSECVFVSQTSATELDEWLKETSKDLTGFERRIQDTKALKNQLDLLLADFQAQDLAELASFLDRIRNNASYSEDLLEDKVQLSLLTTVHGAPANARAHLFKLFFDAQGEKLTSSDLRNYLDGHGHGVVDDLQLKPSTAELHAVTDRYLKTVQDIAIANEVIPRAEADNIIELLADPETKAVLVLGPAGSGKSGVVRQVVLKAIDRGWPVLAFRADGIGEVHDAEQLGAALHLPTSPAAALAGIGGNETALLVIDQMDAVSLTSGRQHASFQALRELIDDVSIQDRVRVVIACREFDATHDYRMKALFDDDRHRMNSIPVPPLDRGTVETILRRLAIDPDGLGDKQYEVLKTPLHLALLAEIRETDLARAMDFIDPQELFDVYWDRKRQRLVERLGRPVLWNSVIDTACDATEGLRQLTFPWSYMSEVEDDARALVSEGVLVNRDDKVSFFHEQLLDYAFARRLTERGISLVQLLTGGEQDLYRRAQVRQVLTYERVARPKQYLDDLTMLLSDQQIRFHIKQAAVWHLGTLRDPSVDEWDILKTHLEQVDGQLSQLIAQLVRSSSQWFELLVQTGYMAAWLQSQEGRLVDRGVEVLASRCREQPDEVAQLLEPHVDDPSAWSNRLLLVLSWNRPSTRRLLNVYLRLIDSGVLGDARGPIAVNSDFWDLAYGLADDHPDWAAEFAAHRLRRQLKMMAERVGDQGVAP